MKPFDGMYFARGESASLGQRSQDNDLPAAIASMARLGSTL